MNTFIPDSVFDYFARDPSGPMWNAGRALESAPQDVVLGLNALLDAIPQDQVGKTQKDTLFRHLVDRQGDTERAARIWIVERCLSKEIARRKLATLCEEADHPRPAPYH